MKPGTDAGAMPVKVSENIRPTLIAGLAKLEELVKKYAAPKQSSGSAASRPSRGRLVLMLFLSSHACAESRSRTLNVMP